LEVANPRQSTCESKIVIHSHVDKRTNARF
jgi:hypothetical protein